jgi:hypothetical protein
MNNSTQNFAATSLRLDIWPPEGVLIIPVKRVELAPHVLDYSRHVLVLAFVGYFALTNNITKTF